MQLIKVVSRKIDDNSKIYGIIPRGGTCTQQDFRQQILNLTGSEPHPHASAIHLAGWSSKNKNKDIIQ